MPKSKRPRTCIVTTSEGPREAGVLPHNVPAGLLITKYEGDTQAAVTHVASGLRLFSFQGNHRQCRAIAGLLRDAEARGIGNWTRPGEALARDPELESLVATLIRVTWGLR